MIKKKSVVAAAAAMSNRRSVVAAAMAMSMMASLSTTAYAGTIASGVTPIVASAETSGANYSAGATGTSGSESSTGIVEATGALEGTTASAGSTNQSSTTQAMIGGAGTATSETLASVNASTMQAITAAGSTDTTHALVSSSGSSAGTPANSIGTTSFGPMVPSTTGSSTGSLNQLCGNGTSTSGSSNVLNALSTVPLPAGYYCSNVGTYTYQEMQVDLNSLKATYPKMQMDVLGNTIDGRQLYHVVVGNPSAPHKILVHGGIHAREYISSQLVMREIVALLEMQQNNLLYLHSLRTDGEPGRHHPRTGRCRCAEHAGGEDDGHEYGRAGSGDGSRHLPPQVEEQHQRRQPES